jgi:hypothetical protein
VPKLGSKEASLPDSSRPLWERCGGFKDKFYFPFHIWDVLLPIDELIFFKMVKTTNQYIYTHLDLLCLSSHFGKEN